MPLWQIYYPERAFTNDDKSAIAEQVTALYQNFLPRFYVNVMFVPLPESTFYIGGAPAGDFVRVTIDHIAAQMKDAERQTAFLNAAAKLLSPYVADRGLRWEMHIDETPFALWTIQGLRPPAPGTPAAKKWQSENRPSPYPS
jgi:phenylpyruvate tautomerase PptA (4-oxalocrotonate tautomerase family)